LISVRLYKPSDFAAALGVINTAAAADRTRRLSDATFRRALSGNLATQAAIAEQGKTVTGFFWWDMLRGSDLRLEGWVHPDWRRSGIATTLLAAAEAAIRRRESLPLTLNTRTYVDIPGSETLFRLRGYQEVRRFYLMSMPLREFEITPLPGIVLRTFRPDDLPALVEADNAIFADHWGSYQRTLAGWKRDMMETRPYDPSLWVIACAGDQIVGECLCHLSREFGPADGWVSVVGVRKEWRGRGIGRAVLVQGLHTLRKSGFVTGSLHVDAENTPAVTLYRDVGMEVARTRLHFARTIG
jgi:mycothiol synthase